MEKAVATTRRGSGFRVYLLPGGGYVTLAGNPSHVEIFSEDGEVIGMGGEHYGHPMTATSTYGERRILVKKGDPVRNYFPEIKQVTDIPPTKRIEVMYSHEEYIKEKDRREGK